MKSDNRLDARVMDKVSLVMSCAREHLRYCRARMKEINMSSQTGDDLIDSMNLKCSDHDRLLREVYHCIIFGEDTLGMATRIFKNEFVNTLIGWWILHAHRLMRLSMKKELFNKIHDACMSESLFDYTEFYGVYQSMYLDAIMRMGLNEDVFKFECKQMDSIVTKLKDLVQNAHSKPDVEYMYEIYILIIDLFLLGF